MCSVLIRGYLSQGFEAWTVPCLYVAGKHLRVFAIKADDERNSSGGGNSNENAGDTFQDDFDPESEKHQLLEDCARQLNRIFNLCLSDRYVYIRPDYLALSPRLINPQGTTRGLPEMGHLLCDQPAI